ncbi:FG-GAP repeat domain-containing protein [Nannocystis bainbridge]|uniref:VCBS repeat-containing protein n=1 Tax=Nannocystis bainbridge TaxID=2995303 RepID=A0ABT5EBM4_9BACT|nr:VCBS repeat-containing protein [Nannocystis bainbridge]MDC0723278.1 VCBS repeat-containing protein [Nannocystis bainbridge]
MQTRLTWIAAGVWVTACGPLPPQGDTAGEQTSTSSPGSSMGDPTEPGTTAPTSSTSETSGTSGPPPECQSDGDCDGFCEYCVEGECYDAVGCCREVPLPGGDLALRCQGYECYGDEDCYDGDECQGSPGWCAPIEAIPLCERLPLTPSKVVLQGRAEALALADLDGDAALDLVVVLPEQGQVEVLLGDGLGGFAPGGLFPTELDPGMQRLAIADFDGDGSLDLAVSLAAPVSPLSLLFGKDAVFAAPVQGSLGNAPRQLWSGDFDGDGRPDLLARGDDDPDTRLALHLGDGVGGFGAAFGAVMLGTTKFEATVGPVGGDQARLDVLLTGWNGPQVDVREFVDGEGLALREELLGPGLVALTSVVAGDFDGDGQIDVLGHREAQGKHLLSRWSQGLPQSELRVEGPVLLGPVADVDGDGAGDLVTGSTDAVRVIFVAGGQGPCVQSHAVAGGAAPELLAAGDFDGDGKADVIAGGPEQTAVALLRSGP